MDWSNFAQTYEGKLLLQQICLWKNFWAVGPEGVDWINLAQEKDKWRAVNFRAS